MATIKKLYHELKTLAELPELTAADDTDFNAKTSANKQAYLYDLLKQSLLVVNKQRDLIDKLLLEVLEIKNAGKNSKKMEVLAAINGDKDKNKIKK